MLELKDASREVVVRVQVQRREKVPVRVQPSPRLAELCLAPKSPDRISIVLLAGPCSIADVRMCQVTQKAVGLSQGVESAPCGRHKTMITYEPERRPTLRRYVRSALAQKIDLGLSS